MYKIEYSKVQNNNYYICYSLWSVNAISYRDIMHACLIPSFLKLMLHPDHETYTYSETSNSGLSEERTTSL